MGQKVSYVLIYNISYHQNQISWNIYTHTNIKKYIPMVAVFITKYTSITFLKIYIFDLVTVLCVFFDKILIKIYIVLVFKLIWPWSLTKWRNYSKATQ